jgi:hypothetical protein
MLLGAVGININLSDSSIIKLSEDFGVLSFAPGSARLNYGNHSKNR